MGDLQPITNDMITETTKNRKFQAQYFIDNVQPILVNARRYFSTENRNTARLNAESFKEVYVTSDIHSDLRKFIELLVNARLITIPAGLNLYSDDIYNPALYTNTVWNKNKVALIILGDLVDGKRNDGKVDDKKGSFELLLHIFLYNMRLKALDKESMLVFTFGNHDYHTCIDVSEYITNTYTPKELKKFFGITNEDKATWVTTRQNALLPFYEVHPLFLISIGYNGRHELYGIHGGFHTANKEIIAPQLIAFQKQISAMNHETSLKTIMTNPAFDRSALFRKTIVTNEDGAEFAIEDGGLWSRVYQDLDSCEIIDGLAKNVVMIVVGHCPNIYDYSYRQAQTMSENAALYAGCQSNTDDGRGCVTLSCSHRLAHVDVAMSSAFHGDLSKEEKEARDAEMLVLKHDGLLKTDERYFNIVERFSKTGGSIEMYRAPALAGGRRKKTRRAGGRRPRRASRRTRHYVSRH